MSFNNPTAVKVGQTGTFFGITYRVLGRVVLGVVDDGTTYYWTEFNLQSDSGESTTLVYELTDNGVQWRLFTMFEPQFPITAADAATKGIGDPINLDGTDVKVTLRDNSRVYFIEGQAPEGVEVGDRAEYFNAEAGKTMIVVSWTGDEVECYHGVTISARTVAEGFNIPPETLIPFSLAGTNAPRSNILSVVIVLGIAILFGCVVLSHLPARRAPAVTRIAATSAKLTIGNSGKLEGKNYTIVSDALVELNEVGMVFQRHEFHLRDDDGNGALLIRGWQPGAKDWCLLKLTDPWEPMTPQQAAAIHSGQSINTGSEVTPVDALFRSIIVQVTTADILQSATGHVYYGFCGSQGSRLLLTRWDESAVTFYKGDVLLEDPTSVFEKHAE